MNSELLGALSQSLAMTPPAFVLGVCVPDVGVVWPWATNVSLCECEQLKGKRKKSDNHIQSWTIYLSNEKRAINSIASAFRPPLSDCLCPQLPKKGPSATRPQPSTAHNDAAKRHRCDAPGNSETSCKNGFQCLNLSASKRIFQPFLYYDTMI